MLQRWGAFNAPDAGTTSAGQASAGNSYSKETPEHREHRLREQYEEALISHQKNDHERARDQFSAIAADLRESQLMRRAALSQKTLGSNLPQKRQRTENSPLWERRLRYAVHRNLAEAHFVLCQYVEALEAYVAALDDDRSDFLIWVRAARSASHCGRLHVARRAYETALSLRPSHWLCEADYRAVLQAIGDADEDCCSASTFRVHEPFQQAVQNMLQNRDKYLMEELKEKHHQPVNEPEVVRVRELTWGHLVDVLKTCLESRLENREPLGNRPVAHPLKFQYPSVETLASQVLGEVSDEDYSDEVQFVSQSSHPPRAATTGDDMEVVPVRMSERKESMPGTGTGNKTPQEVAPEKSAQPPRNTPINSTVPDIAAVGTVFQHADVPIPQATEDSSIAVQKRATTIDVEEDVKKVTYVAEEVAQLSSEKETGKQPEIRRSSRQKSQIETALHDGERRQTRTIADMKDSIQEDKDLIQGLLAMCHVEHESQAGVPDIAHSVELRPERNSGEPNSTSVPSLDEKSEGLERTRQSTRAKYVDEREEAETVEKCLKSFDVANSGPTDLLLRVLECLSQVKVAQYASTLATLWIVLRDKLLLHLPGPADATVLIAEALLESGKKAGKAKLQRFQEARRILANVSLASRGQDDAAFLRIRISWLWSLLHESCGEMQMSFSFAEQTLALLSEARTASGSNAPEVLGPSLSGFSLDELSVKFSRRISNLKTARDLEHAKEELRKDGDDSKEAAKRTVSILSPSIHASVRELRLDTWQNDDLKVDFSSSSELERWENMLDAEADLEPRLAVFGEACAKSSDVVGELVCFSVRLRMAVHYYAACFRAEKMREEGALEEDFDSSSAKLSDLLVQIRKYVAVIKKISTPSSSGALKVDTGISGWSLERAVTISCITLASMTSLLVAKIPLQRFTPSGEDLNGSQRNQRLGFMRCMLAYARCILLIHKDDPPLLSMAESHSKVESITIRMLYVTSFCLRALVARGCCREEGTSGALIKLYLRFLLARLQEIASDQLEAEKELKMRSGDGTKTQQGNEHEQLGSRQSVLSPSSQPEAAVPNDDTSDLDKEDASYQWRDVAVLRHEISQCFECLYKVDDLESSSGDSTIHVDHRWLQEGCHASKNIGLTFNAGDSSTSKPAMDVDMCKNVYLFYRQRIFEGVCRRRRDGGRAKRHRELLSRLAEALPENPPHGVPMLPFQAFDKIVSDVVETREGVSKRATENVSRLEEQWNQCQEDASEEDENRISQAKKTQVSILFFEVFALHAMSTLAAHEAEYKKQKNAERRKRPKEAADRLLSASSDCIIALRSRPWSVGAWILLGRIFIEISDLVLDERELNFSSFGLYRTEDLAALGDGEAVDTVLSRAEACFGFAESLLTHSWSKGVVSQARQFSAAHVLGMSCHGDDDETWHGFGDDGDLFAILGLTNETTSRPILRHEPHPCKNEDQEDVHRIAAIRLGEAATSILRLREQRYFHLHWNQSTMECRLPAHPRNRFPEELVELGTSALRNLREGQAIMSVSRGCREESVTVGLVEAPQHASRAKPSAVPHHQRNWRTGYANMEKAQWYYTLIEAKLVRKTGGKPQEYLALFQRAIDENKSLKEALRQPPDIEPFYKLHVSRMKILRGLDNDGNTADMLTLLEKYSFKRNAIVLDVATNNDAKEMEDWIAERKISVAEDILSAMQYCADPKSEVQYAEYYFKPTFCKALILSELLRDTGSALEELGKLFRVEAAAKVLDQGPDGTHRGYFYKLWNYRITDTGIEPALESERKFVRWRSKILGLYGQLLRQCGEWRLLAAIVYRLRKRSSEDLPVDGAVLDDLILAYATTSRAAILNSMEKGILSSAAVFESSYRRTWDIYVETLRLAQGIKRVRNNYLRGERSETGAERLLKSGRPRCLVAVHTALRLEHMRWKSVQGGPDTARAVNLEDLKAMPVEGSMEGIAERIRLGFVETVQISASKWPLDEKLMKLLVRRVAEYTASEAE